MNLFGINFTPQDLTLIAVVSAQSTVLAYLHSRQTIHLLEILAFLEGEEFNAYLSRLAAYWPCRTGDTLTIHLQVGLAFGVARFKIAVSSQVCVARALERGTRPERTVEHG